MTLMDRIVIMYVFFAYGHVCDACVPSLLCMFAAHDAVGTKQVGGTEMEKHRKVSGLIKSSEVQRCIIKFVAVI